MVWGGSIPLFLPMANYHARSSAGISGPQGRQAPRAFARRLTLHVRAGTPCLDEAYGCVGASDLVVRALPVAVNSGFCDAI